MRHNKGFSLIELMMVVIIISVLVTIALPNYARSVERAKCAQAMGTIKSLRNALGSWYTAHGEYTGADATTLGNEVYATFQDNDDWEYAIAVSAATYEITATRQRGPHSESPNLVVDEMGNFDTIDSNYPYTNPGNW